jgi:hypothetical protein
MFPLLESREAGHVALPAPANQVGAGSQVRSLNLVPGRESGAGSYFRSYLNLVPGRTFVVIAFDE